MDSDAVHKEVKILEANRDDKASLDRRSRKSGVSRRKRQRSENVVSSASSLMLDPQQTTTDPDNKTTPQHPTPVARVVPLLLDGKAIVGCTTTPRWMRVIDPYPHTFTSFAKQRWIGRSILDVYTTEFGSYPESYYRTAIEQGRIQVRDKKVSPDYRIQRMDVLQHTVHRHEPAVYVSCPTSPFVNIVAETIDCLVVDKPGSMPIHPCGGYHLNSLVPLLEASRAASLNDDTKHHHHNNTTNKLYTIHRLDRLTSGLVVLAKSSQVASEWAQSISSRECQKLYLAKVQGKFPQRITSQVGLVARCNNVDSLPQNGERQQPQQQDLQQLVPARQRNAHGWWISNVNDVACPDVTLDDLRNNSLEHSTVSDWLTALDAIQKDGGAHASTQNERSAANATSTSQARPAMDLYWLNLACPTRVVEPKNGVCACGTFDELTDEVYARTVKAAQTSFAVLHYDVTSDSTVLLCRPQTGRTHQIRIHLQHLGHPIANDPNYGGTMWYGNPHGKEICERAQEVLNDANDQVTIHGANDITSSTGLVTSDQPATEDEVEQCAAIARVEDETLDEFIRRTCVWCARNPSGRDDRAALELLVRSPGIWLHALQYSVVTNSQRVTFRTNLPAWSTVQTIAGNEQRS